jgi:hypothetical protein
MKTKRLFPVLIFLAGIVAGGVLLSILAFTSPNPAPAPISANAARTFFRNYMVHAIPYSNVIKGYTISREQYNAMTEIIGLNPSVTGFRIYNGVDDNGLAVGMVVGVTAAGNDYLTGSEPVRSTDARQGVGPCPTVCDNPSPIIN